MRKSVIRTIACAFLLSTSSSLLYAMDKGDMTIKEEIIKSDQISLLTYKETPGKPSEEINWLGKLSKEDSGIRESQYLGRNFYSLDKNYYEKSANDILEGIKDLPEKTGEGKQGLFSFYIHDIRGALDKAGIKTNIVTATIKVKPTPENDTTGTAIAYVKQKDDKSYAPAIFLINKEGNLITYPCDNDYLDYFSHTRLPKGADSVKAPVSEKSKSFFNSLLRLSNLNIEKKVENKESKGVSLDDNKGFYLFHDVLNHAILKGKEIGNESGKTSLIPLGNKNGEERFFFYHHNLLGTQEDLENSFENYKKFFKNGEKFSSQRVKISTFSSYLDNNEDLKIFPLEVTAEKKTGDTDYNISGLSYFEPDAIFVDENGISDYTIRNFYQKQMKPQPLPNYEEMSSLEYLGLFLKVLSEKKSLGEVLTENPGIKEKLSWTQEEERILNLYQGNIIQNRESLPQPFQMPEGVWHYPTAQEGIKMLVKAVVDHVPNGTLPQEGAKYNGFEKGAILVKGLSQEQAQFIYQKFKKESYDRKSTHGLMNKGIDLESKYYISTPHETFRHALFSIPRPDMGTYEKTGKENIHLDKSLFDKDLNNKVLEDNLNNPVYNSKKFYMHLKPESHGTKTLGDFVGHSASFLASRFGPKYKGLPIFYGEKSGFSKDGEGQLKESGNGSFVIDISEYDKPKT